MRKEKRHGLAVLWLRFPAGFESVGVDQDGGEEERGEFGRDGVGGVLREEGSDERRAAPSRYGNNARVRAVLIQPLVLVVVDDSDDARLRGRGGESASETVMVYERELVGRGGGGEVVEAEQVLRGVDAGLGERVEVLGAQDEVGAGGVDEGDGECAAGFGGVPGVGDRAC